MPFYPTPGIPLIEKGAPLGVATLGIDSKVPASQIPTAVSGGLAFQGVYDAATNTPDLTNPTFQQDGHLYIVSVAGTQDIGNGAETFTVGDSVFYSSVETRWYCLQSSILAFEVIFDNTGTNIIGSNLQDAVVELDSRIVDKTILSIPTTFYVDGTAGSNGNDGSIGTPWADVTYGMNFIIDNYINIDFITLELLGDSAFNGAIDFKDAQGPGAYTIKLNDHTLNVPVNTDIKNIRRSRSFTLVGEDPFVATFGVITGDRLTFIDCDTSLSIGDIDFQNSEVVFDRCNGRQSILNEAAFLLNTKFTNCKTTFRNCSGVYADGFEFVGDSSIDFINCAQQVNLFGTITIRQNTTKGDPYITVEGCPSFLFDDDTIEIETDTLAKPIFVFKNSSGVMAPDSVNNISGGNVTLDLDTGRYFVEVSGQSYLDWAFGSTDFIDLTTTDRGAKVDDTCTIVKQVGSGNDIFDLPFLTPQVNDISQEATVLGIDYDNTASGLAATTKHTAIDELAAASAGRIRITTTLDLFVDADSGNDSNDGSSIGQAFATNARLMVEIAKYEFVFPGRLNVNYVPNTILLDPLYIGSNDSVPAYNWLGNGAIEIKSTAVGQIRFDADGGDGGLFINPEATPIKPRQILINNQDIWTDKDDDGYFVFSNAEIITITSGTTLEAYCININDCDNLGITNNCTITTADGVFIKDVTKAFSTSGTLTLGGGVFFFDNINGTNSWGNTSLTGSNGDYSSFVYNFEHCRNLSISGGISYGSVTDTGSMSFDYSNAKVSTFYTGTSGASGGLTSAFKLTNQSTVEYVPVTPATFTITGVTNKVEVDETSKILTPDPLFPHLPFDGAINIAATGVLNLPNAEQIDYDTAISGLTATKVKGAIDELAGRISSQAKLTADTTFYINVGTGSDTTGDGSSGNPWQTMQFALNYIEKLDCNNFTPTIEAANGNYTGEGRLHLPPIRNPKTVTCGGGGSPPNAHLIIQAAVASGALFEAFEADQDGYYGLFQLRIDIPNTNAEQAIVANRGATITVSDCNLYGPNETNPTGFVFRAADAGNIFLKGNVIIENKPKTIFSVNNGGGIYTDSDGAAITIAASNTGTTNYNIFQVDHGTVDIAGGSLTNSAAAGIFNGTTLNGGVINIGSGVTDDLIANLDFNDRGWIDGYRVGVNLVSIFNNTLTSNETLNLGSAEYQFVTCDTPSLNYNLPVVPLQGMHFIIKNLDASTESFTTNSVIIAPGGIYEVVYNGSAWIVL